MKKPRTERIARNAFGLPCLTKRQLTRVHEYATDLVVHGKTRRVCSPLLLSAALCEISFHASSVRHQLEQFITGTAKAAPAALVARLAIEMLQHMQHLAPEEQVQYLNMLCGDDESVVMSDGHGKPHASKTH